MLSLYGSDVNVPWQRRITRLAVGHTDSRIYVSDNLRATMGDPDGQVIPMGVDLELFRPVSRRAARAALGIDHDAPIVLFGGDPANRVKGYDLFSHALERMGGGARRLLLPDESRRAVALKYAAADVLLFTSRQGSEGSPGVVKEAVATGLPVVSVDVGDVRRTLDGVSPSAVVGFGPGLADRLAEQCTRILCRGMRSNGPDGSSRFDWRTTAQHITNVYAQVVNTVSGPA